MTYFTHTSHDNRPPGDRSRADPLPDATHPAAPTSYRLACAALGVIVTAYMRVIRSAMPDMDQVLWGALRLQRHVRRIARIAHRLRQHERRAALREDPALREQVRGDLGGVIAMTAWEVRRRRAWVLASAQQAQGRIKPQAPPATHATTQARGFAPDFGDTPTELERAHPQKRWRPKTDRNGDYRLAVIPTRRREKRCAHSRPGHAHHRHRSASHVTGPMQLIRPRFDPLQVTPTDLASPHKFGEGADLPPIYAAPGHSPRLPTGYTAPIHRWPKKEAG